jgi:predicted aldo/keto reductase-like oxidoreductase
MPNMTILQANVAAALNKNKLSLRDKQLFEQYAQKTAGGYCTGCADICESAVDFRVPISDLLRCSMYYNSYGDRDKALALFNALPAEKKANILKTDYSEAEKYCPQKMQISKILKKTHGYLS